MERGKSAEAMWKQIFSDSKNDLVNWKLKWNINPKWEINTIENYIKKTVSKLLEAIQTTRNCAIESKKHIVYLTSDNSIDFLKKNRKYWKKAI